MCQHVRQTGGANTSGRSSILFVRNDLHFQNGWSVVALSLTTGAVECLVAVTDAWPTDDEQHQASDQMWVMIKKRTRWTLTFRSRPTTDTSHSWCPAEGRGRRREWGISTEDTNGDTRRPGHCTIKRVRCNSLGCRHFSPPSHVIQVQKLKTASRRLRRLITCTWFVIYHHHHWPVVRKKSQCRCKCQQNVRLCTRRWANTRRGQGAGADTTTLDWVTYIVEVGELDLNGGRQESRGGVDDHRHHFGVEQGGVAAEREEVTRSVLVHMGLYRRMNMVNRSVW